MTLRHKPSIIYHSNITRFIELIKRQVKKMRFKLQLALESMFHMLIIKKLRVIIENLFLYEERTFLMPWKQYITGSWKIKNQKI